MDKIKNVYAILCRCITMAVLVIFDESIVIERNNYTLFRKFSYDRAVYFYFFYRNGTPFLVSCGL